MVTSRVQEIHINNSNGIRLYVKREDLIHPFVSGNKYRKLKYNLIEAKRHNRDTLITFGGAFSNHIAAVAYAGRQNGFKTIGVIRGEELSTKIKDNPTLRFAQKNGMQFQFVSRKDYRHKNQNAFQDQLKENYNNAYIIPEGGTNELAVKGCEEILQKDDFEYQYVCCCVGTGGTISGLINSSSLSQTVLGFPVLKGGFLQSEITKFVTKSNWKLITDYHFGGYAKINEELITFINDFKSNYGIPLDPIYTGKMMFGLFDLIQRDRIEPYSKILAIHTGGLQGIDGMNMVLKSRGLPMINV